VGNPAWITAGDFDGDGNDDLATVSTLAGELCFPKPTIVPRRVEIVYPGGIFQRGDANADGAVDISDSIFVLGFLFLGGDSPPCLDAADSDDSGSLDITDGAALNNFLFLGDRPPPPPGPFACGVDPTADDLGCRAFPGCP
jgi:hypothetical protein